MKNPLEILIINKGYNQTDLAKKMDMSSKTLHWQLKHYDDRPFSFYVRLAKALNISKRKLLRTIGLI